MAGKVILGITMALLLSIIANAQCVCKRSWLSDFKSQVSDFERAIRKGQIKEANKLILKIDRYLKGFPDSCKPVLNVNCKIDSWLDLKTDVIKFPNHAFIKQFKNLRNIYSDFFSTVASLQPEPEEPLDIDSLIKKNVKPIDSIVKLTKDSVDSSLKRLDTVRGRVDTIVAAIIELESLFIRRMDSIDSHLRMIDTTLRFFKIVKTNAVSIAVISNNIFGIAYTRVWHKQKPDRWIRKNSFVLHGGGQLLLNCQKGNQMQFGGALLGGFRDNRLAFLFGPCYLPKEQSDDLSWKGALDYYTERFGFGVSYSPMLKTGFRLTFQF